MTVAEEQSRQATADQDNPTFVPASSAAMEAFIMSQTKDTRDVEMDKKLHPLFRRRSSSISEISGVANGSKGAAKTKTKKAVTGGKGKKKAIKEEEEIFEVLSSDEEAAAKGRSKGREDSAVSEAEGLKAEDEVGM